MWAELRSWASVEDYIPQCFHQSWEEKTEAQTFWRTMQDQLWLTGHVISITDRRQILHTLKKKSDQNQSNFSCKKILLCRWSSRHSRMNTLEENKLEREKKKKQSLNIHRMFTLSWSGDNPDPTLGKRIRGELLNVDEWSVYKCPVIGALNLKDGYKNVQVWPTAAPSTSMSQLLLLDNDTLTWLSCFCTRSFPPQEKTIDCTD